MGAGAYRISSREFREQYYKTKKEIAERLHVPRRALNRNELGGRVSGHVLAHLENCVGRKVDGKHQAGYNKNTDAFIMKIFAITVLQDSGR